jgi:hypothetical protein
MRLTRANRDAVNYSCLYYHYAKLAPSSYSYAYNIYNDNNEWCGCILFGLGANSNMSKFLNCITGTCLELQRVALNGKQGHNATSRAVSMAMREVKKDAVYLKCLFSYADTEQKHTGIIYQATNWIYIGNSEGSHYIGQDGKRYHSRTVNHIKERTGKTAQDMGFIRIKVPKKYLYIYPFDKKLKKQLIKKQKPYPKKKDEYEDANG